MFYHPNGIKSAKYGKFLAGAARFSFWADSEQVGHLPTFLDHLNLPEINSIKGTHASPRSFYRVLVFGLHAMNKAV